MINYTRLLISNFLVALLIGGILCLASYTEVLASSQNESYTQTTIIGGTVIDSETRDPLPGVNVVVKNTTTGVATDLDGKYELTLDSPDVTLVFTFVGYQSKEVEVDEQFYHGGNERYVIDVALQSQSIIAEEMVVIGYGSVRDEDLTGSISKIKAQSVQTPQVYNITEALQSLSAGVRVTQGSGDPASGIEIKIRGANSIVGNSDPLYVVDGFPLTGGAHYVNPGDVESITVLKDASATAIYGSRGANGVVIIETKKGKFNQSGQIEIDSYYGIQREIDRFELLNAEQYAIVANEWMRNDGREAYFSNPGQIQGVTDWQEEIFRTSPIESHTVTFSGGSQSTSYSLAGNFFQQEGIIVNSGVQRGSIRLNLNHNVNNRISLTGNALLSRRQIDRQSVDNGGYGGSIYTNALTLGPTVPLYDETGLPTEPRSIYPWSDVDHQNPLVYTGSRKNRVNANTILTDATLKVNLVEGLEFTSRAGVEYDFSVNEFFAPIIYPADQGSISESFNYNNSFLTENLLEYSSNIGNSHELSVLGGVTYQTYMGRGLSASASGLSSNILEHYDLSSAEIQNTPSNGITEWSLLSSLGRINYSFQNKYLFTASARADGSSRFGDNNKWGFFPSGAISWRVSEESFMENVTFIDNLKIRASYGITGNTSINPYQTLSRIRSFRHVEESGIESPAYVPDALPNPDLKWEETTQANIGFDMSILRDKVNFTFDYYKKNTKDLLSSVPLPSSTGFSSVLQNIGEIENKGVELTIGANIIQSADLFWDLNGQISKNINTVKKLASGSDLLIGGGSPFFTSTHIVREGETLGSYFGYIEQDQLDENGFVQYVDFTGDGEITTEDRVILGNFDPDFMFGLESNVGYKNFQLNILIDGVYGNEIFWETAGVHLNSMERGSNQFADLFGNYWSVDNPDPNAKYPKISRNTTHELSDRFIYDGSYLRLKSLRLAYTLPENALNGLRVIRGVQIYGTATNLFTITNYPGLSPDVSTRSGLRPGVDKVAYPDTKNLVFGIKLEL